MFIPSKDLPLGYPDFEKIRKLNCVYVDKTDLIAALVRNSGSYFLSRPRRFGKSTLVSTIKTLFERGLDAFEGLKIAQYTKEQLKLERPYKVLHLSFATYKEEQQNQTIEEYYIQEIRDFFESLGISIDSSHITLSGVFKAGLNQLKEDIVLLIDEYDAPLVSYLDDETKFTELRKIFSNFYQVVKQYDAKFRFIFLTGVARFSNLSIFSGLNQVQDISFISRYGNIVGYTQEELESYFKEYIENASTVLNEKYKTDKYTADYILSQLKLNYDGYSFDTEANCHVYNPWSILNFFQYPEEGFKPYWVATGGAYPALLRNYLNNLLIEASNLKFLDIDALESTDVLSLSPSFSGAPKTADELTAILYQAGYYSIKEISYSGLLKIGIPNGEVKKAIAELIVCLLTQKQTIKPLDNKYRDDFQIALDNNNINELRKIFSAIYNEISYDSIKHFNEASFRDILRLSFLLFGQHVQTEVPNAQGRADLIVTTKNTMYVIELKIAKTKDEVNTKAQEAKNQLINRKYAERVTDHEIIPLALVILNQPKSKNSDAILDVSVLERV